MKYVVFFFLVGGILGTTAIRGGGALLLLLWPGVSFTLVGMAYAGLGAPVFGKQADGTLHWLSTWVLFPYLGFSWIIWHIARMIKRERAFDTLVDGIVIGRRLLPDEYPSGIASVVDLTCEFPEPKAVRDGRTYCSLPVLDASVPSNDALEDLVKEIATLRRDVYVHCAEGHGRTAMVAAALLVCSGEATDPEKAIELVLRKRPKARMNSAQRQTVDSFAATVGRRSGRVHDARRHGQ